MGWLVLRDAFRCSPRPREKGDAVRVARRHMTHDTRAIATGYARGAMGGLSSACRLSSPSRSRRNLDVCAEHRPRRISPLDVRHGRRADRRHVGRVRGDRGRVCDESRRCRRGLVHAPMFAGTSGRRKTTPPASRASLRGPQPNVNEPSAASLAPPMKKSSVAADTRR